MIDHFNNTIDSWINELDRYEFDEFCTRPSPASWSIGQVYMHLAAQTEYYISQIAICISSDKNQNETASAAGREMLFNNSFPDEMIEGPPENSNTPQPGSKEELRQRLMNIRDDMNRLAKCISKSRPGGKTKHPGLNYFSAIDWLQFADMHFRHHLRQKRRIDNFLVKH